MTSKVQQIFSELEPYRVLRDLGIPMTRIGADYHIADPSVEGSTLIITRNELLPTSPVSPVPGYSIFEFLRLYLGGYEDVVKHLLTNYPDLVKLPAGMDVTTEVRHVTRELLGLQTQFLAVTSLQTFDPERHGLKHVRDMWCRNQDISIETLHRVAFINTGAQIAKKLGFYVPNLSLYLDRVYLVLPFFKTRSIFAHLVIQDLEKKEPPTEISLNDASHSFFGLPTCLPGYEVQVYNNTESTLNAWAAVAEHSLQHIGCVHVLTNGGATRNDTRLPHGIFVKTNTQDISHILNVRSAFDKLQVASHTTNTQPGHSLNTEAQDLSYSVVADFQKLVQEDEMPTARVNSFINELSRDQGLMRVLTAFLQSKNLIQWLQFIKATLGALKTYQLGSVTIEETKTGYVARRPSATISSAFTNFLIRVDQNIWFEDTEELFFGGRVLLQGHEYPFLISNKHTNRKGEIETEALRSVRRINPESGPGQIPIVHDTSLTKHLPTLITTQAGERSTVIGVCSLGWNDSKTRFTTPIYLVHATGITQTSRIPHPTNKILKNFQFRDVRQPEVTTLPNSDANALLAVLASMLVRGYLGLKTPVFSVMRTPETLSILPSIFHALGQFRPIELSDNTRANVGLFRTSMMNGYPTFCLGANTKQLSGIDHPIMLLTDNGLLYSGKSDADTLEHVSAFSSTVIRRLVLAALRHQHDLHSVIRQESITDPDQMLYEGKRIIETFCGVSELPIVSVRLNFLTGITMEALAGNLHPRLREQTTMINLEKLRTDHGMSYSNEEVLEEIQAVIPEAENTSDYLISAPTPELNALLSRFYGDQIIPLPPPPPPPVMVGMDGSKLSMT